MKAKKKPIEEIALDKLGIDLTTNLEVIKTEEPIKRKGGAKVKTVDELIEKLTKEAKLF